MKTFRIYFTERNGIMIPRVSFVALAGMNFYSLAPQYVPGKPPTPNKAPERQSGAMPKPV